MPNGQGSIIRLDMGECIDNYSHFLLGATGMICGGRRGDLEGREYFGDLMVSANNLLRNKKGHFYLLGHQLAALPLQPTTSGGLV